MSDSNRVPAAALAAIRSRVVHALPDQIRKAVQPLTDEQIWWRPNDSSNSIGNLLLHVTGSLNHYLNRGIGGIAYERDRSAEFAERGPVARAELLARFDRMVAGAEKTLDAVTVDRLGDPSPEPSMNRFVIDDLLGIVTHLSTHAGQIVWVAKMITGAPLDEVWIKTHRAYVWPAKKA